MKPKRDDMLIRIQFAVLALVIGAIVLTQAARRLRAGWDDGAGLRRARRDRRAARDLVRGEAL